MVRGLVPGGSVVSGTRHLMQRSGHSALLALSVVALCACPKGGGGGVPDAGGVNRCQVDLASTGYFKQGGTGASAKVIDWSSGTPVVKPL